MKLFRWFGLKLIADIHAGSLSNFLLARDLIDLVVMMVAVVGLGAQVFLRVFVK